LLDFRHIPLDLLLGDAEAAGKFSLRLPSNNP